MDGLGRAVAIMSKMDGCGLGVAEMAMGGWPWSVCGNNVGGWMGVVSM